MSENQPRTRYRPIIRVFVSSTFADLKHERNALQQHVFLPLEEFCAARKFLFQAIDMRWGVSTEASFDHRTMQICFSELLRAQDISPKPNFLILLGNRYGWRPLPEVIFAGEFVELEKAANRISPKAPEVLRKWYRKDGNVLPKPGTELPTYVLQPRTKDGADHRNYQDGGVWDGLEDVLWSIINTAYPPTLLDQRFDQPASVHSPLPASVRFQASATEQEIWRGALGTDDAEDHVLACFREIDNFSAFSRPERLREFIDVGGKTGQIDEGPQRTLAQLKDQLIERLGTNRIHQPIPPAHLIETTGNKEEPTVDVTTDHIEPMCAWVLKELTAIVKEQMDAYWGTREPGAPSPNELAHERRDHELFSQERAQENAFVGRERQLKAMSDYLQGGSHQPLVVHGASGCGKTALLARAAQAARGLKPIVRFLGVTPRSSDVRSLLNMLCRELRDRHPLEAPLSSDLNEVIEELHEQLKSATRAEPIVLFLDALDQLSDADNGRSINWIPFGQLPDNVKLIVSCLSDREEKDSAGEPYRALQRRGIAKENFVDLDALLLNEARELLFKVWLPGASRTLQAAQRQIIEAELPADTARQPLYLKILFEECKLWRSYDALPAKIDNTVQKLLEVLLIRLGADTNHGILLPYSLGYIASAHRGLSELEILEILYQDPEYKEKLDDWTREKDHQLPAEPKRIPIALWSRLRFDLSPYLTEQGAPGGTVLNFYHRQLGEFVRDLFPATAGSKLQWHERLADYFDAKDFWQESEEEQRERARRLPPTPRPVNVRKVDELPWQRLQAAKLGGGKNPTSPYWDKFADLLTNWQFLEAKTEAVP